MSVEEHHAEWRSLLEISGPFPSVNVLADKLPQGLTSHRPELSNLIKAAHLEWRESQQSRTEDSDLLHKTWVKFVLETVLEWPEGRMRSREGQDEIIPSVEVEEYGEELSPDWVLTEPNDEGGNDIRMLVAVWPSDQQLERASSRGGWMASPASRMVRLLRETGHPLGLVTNGEQWMLVYAPEGETSGFASWYATLWRDEPLTIRAFRTLLGVRRFFSVAPTETLEWLYRESAKNQEEVTDQLGRQVLDAVDILVRGIDRANRSRSDDLLKDVSSKELFEGTLTVMMRLVFLMSAEQRELLPYGEPLYDEHYAITPLRDQLRDAADRLGEEVLERRYDAWSRLLATFRSIYGGVEHDAMRMPAYGGELFNPDKYPFLEGRKSGTSWAETEAAPLPISNRIVLHVLEALQVLRPEGSDAAQVLSFRGLDIEQIGYVYERLLDHTVERAEEATLGLVGTSKKPDPDVTIPELQEWRADSRERVVNELKKLTGRTKGAIDKRVDKELDRQDEAKLRMASQGNDALMEEVRPYFHLLDDDSFGYPEVVPAGSVHVTEGVTRRQSGTHYTPRSLTEEVVKHTLEPLVYEGPKAGKPKEEWRLKTADELLGLSICDFAMGSAAFLVEATRYLAERVVEAWERAGTAALPGFNNTIEGLTLEETSEIEVPSGADDRLVLARRLVAERCIYGVDKNPMAVELAKLSMWLITFSKGRPFTFLDHNLRSGDSLLGITELEQLEFFHMDPEPGAVQTVLGGEGLREAVEELQSLKERINQAPSLDIRDIQYKQQLLDEFREESQKLRLAADALTAVSLSTADGNKTEFERTRAEISTDIQEILKNGSGCSGASDDISAMNRHRLGNDPVLSQPRRPFHWPLEFPDVFARDGFDAIVGNPPFLGGKRITTSYSTVYREYLVDNVADSQRGSADLCAYFFLRAGDLVGEAGTFGLLATNTIAQGDTREVGLKKMVDDGIEIIRAHRSQQWPGKASLEISIVWGAEGDWEGERHLGKKSVNAISSYLVPPGAVTGDPQSLLENDGGSYIGQLVLGIGFVLEPDEAADLVDSDPRNADVIFPYLNGSDLNSNPDQSPSRFVINFQDWPLCRPNEVTEWGYKSVDSAPKAVTPRRGYEGPVASDYPDCLGIVNDKVRPLREKSNRKAYREKWWRFAERQPALLDAMSGFDKVMARSRVSNLNSIALVSTDIVMSEAVVVFVSDDFGRFAVLQSSVHDAWLVRRTSTMRTDIRYTPSKCYRTFPFPAVESLKDVGRRYYRYRQRLMRRGDEGLTKLYKRFHDPDENDEAICKLRVLHEKTDLAVFNAYGWQDISAEYEFRQTSQGLRFSLPAEVKREVFDRLLALNHSRYKDEVRRGLHGDALREELKKDAEEAQETLF